MGLGISSAIVATYGELAVDVFYIRDIFGHKVIHPERLAAIEARLMKALRGLGPACARRAGSAIRPPPFLPDAP